MAQLRLPQHRYPDFSLGWVYVAGVPGHPLVKIGKTINPESRLTSLRGVHPTAVMPAGLDHAQIEMFHIEPGGRRYEIALHAYFADRRVIGEWFNLGPVSVSLIKSALRDLRAKDTEGVHRIAGR